MSGEKERKRTQKLLCYYGGIGPISICIATVVTTAAATATTAATTTTTTTTAVTVLVTGQHCSTL